jgi:anti-sigma factor RsiW
MSSRMSCAQVTEHVVAYAWEALDPEERIAVQGHCSECPDCDARLAAARRVVGLLDEALPRVEPPTELRARVLQAVASSAPVDPGAIGSERFTASREADPRVGPHGQRGWRSTPVFRWLLGPSIPPLAAAAVVLVVPLLTWAFLVRPYYEARLSAVQAELARLEEQLAADERIEWTIRSPTTRTIALSPATGSGQAALMFDPERRWGMLIAQHLEPMPVDWAYHVWLVGGGQRLHVGSFTPDDQATGYLLLPDPLPIADPQRIEITRGPTAHPDAGELEFTASF